VTTVPSLHNASALLGRVGSLPAAASPAGAATSPRAAAWFNEAVPLRAAVLRAPATATAATPEALTERFLGSLFGEPRS
jgi:hypothetical protein